jgi:hypothetical protein
MGATLGGMSALGDGDPTTSFWGGAWNGTKSAFVTSAISGAGEAFKYANANDVNVLTGKSNLKGDYSVYEGKDPVSKKVKYVGITERDPNIRWDEHGNSGTPRAGLDYDVVEGGTGLSKTQARIMEQNLINQYGMQKNGGQLLNLRNSIAPKYWDKYGVKY